MSSQMATQNGTASSKILDIDALVVGAGFGGCYLLNLLRKQGLNVKLFEAGTGLGGVWHWNCYPGARVDCEFPYYGFSDPDIWSTWSWGERFPSFQELQRYFNHVDKIWELSKDVFFETQVIEARLQDDGRWLVKTKDGSECRCTWLLACTGTSFKPHIPEWKGVEKFKGPIYHSSLWPKGGVELKDKRVAIIGAGATGVQLMQEAAKVSSHVTQFIKTPGIAVPMRQRQITMDEIYQQRPIIPHIFEACRKTRTGLPITGATKRAFDVSKEERKATYEEQYARGGFNFAIGCFADDIVSKEANRSKYDFWAQKTRARISDPKKRDLLAPLEPHYFIGTKRSSLEQDYYECCDMPHVVIENSPILEFEEKGIVTKEGSREFDVVAIATGYDAVIGGLATMGIKNKDGVELREYWSQGVRTSWGMMVHSFPNMFMVYGPHAPTSFTNGPPFIEMQCEWISDAIAKMVEQNLAMIEPKQDAEERWTKTVHDIANMTLATYTDSWYMGANVPGKRREFLLYLGGIPRWHTACRDALDGFKEFDVKART